eukprot:Colp12_sorted_trinity150504_noHs@27722
MQDETSPLLGEGSINTGANAGKGKKSVWTALNIVVLASCLFVTLCQSLHLPSLSTNVTVTWVVAVSSLVLLGSGMALAVMPTMPQMQQATGHLGPGVQDTVGAYFNALVAIGQGAAPIVGTALTDEVGFPNAAWSLCSWDTCAADLAHSVRHWGLALREAGPGRSS